MSISTSHLHAILGAVKTYHTKFKNRFTGANSAYLRQLVLVLNGLVEFADGWSKQGGKEGDRGAGKREEMVGVNKVMASGGKGALDQINLLKLDEYLRKSRIARKVSSGPDAFGRVMQTVDCLDPSSLDWRLRR